MPAHPSKLADSLPGVPLASLLALCLVLAGVGDPASLGAKSRDSDGSRMQARKIEFPSTHKDALSPPDDAVDWRYFKLGAPRRADLSVTFGGAGAGGRLALTTATGRELAVADQASKKATVSEKLEPGVYYVSVQTKKATGYKLSLE